MGSMIHSIFFSEGRVDAYLIECEGRYGFVDSGFRSNGLNCVKKLKKLGVSKLDWYIGTHAHKNHIGGAGAIIKTFNPDVVIIPHDRVRQRIIKFSLKGTERKAAEAAHYRIVVPGDEFTLGSAIFKVVGPLKIRNASPGLLAENYNSLIIKAIDKSGKFMLLTGDTSDAILNTVQDRFKGTDKAINSCELLKNPHHNGRLPSSTLKMLSPKMVVVCNSSLPSKAYQKLIRSIGAKLFTAAYRSRGGNGNVPLSVG